AGRARAGDRARDRARRPAAGRGRRAHARASLRPGVLPAAAQRLDARRRARGAGRRRGAAVDRARSALALPEVPTYLALDFGGTKFAAGIVDAASGSVLAHTRRAPAGPDEALRVCDGLLAEARVRPDGAG